MAHPSNIYFLNVDLILMCDSNPITHSDTIETPDVPNSYSTVLSISVSRISLQCLNVCVKLYMYSPCIRSHRVQTRFWYKNNHHVTIALLGFTIALYKPQKNIIFICY